MFDHHVIFGASPMSRPLTWTGKLCGSMRGGIVCAALAVAALTPLALQAQGVDSLANDPETILPEIMPREVEILGEYEAQFPSFQRRALTGFNPPPRIYEVPRDRMPYRGDYKQASADLPPAELADPVGPSIAIRNPGTPSRGELSVGFGRLLGREVALRFTPALTRRTAFYAIGAYDGWSNFAPFQDAKPDLETSAQGGTAEAGVKTVQPAFSAGGAVSGFFDSYALYGAEVQGPAETVEQAPPRSGVGAGAHAWIRNATGSDLPFRLSIAYSATRYETDVYTDDRPDPRFRRAEKRLDAEGSFGGRFSSATLALDGKVTVAGLDTDQSLSRDHLAVDFGSTLRLRIGRVARLRLGARFLGYDVIVNQSDREFESALYLSPAAEMDVFLRPGFQLFARNRPGVEVHGLRDLHRQNPFIIGEPLHKPTLTTVNAEAGAVWFAGPVRVSGHVGYESHPHYMYFSRTSMRPTLGSVGGLFEPAYDEATILRAGGDVGLALPGGVSTALAVAWRDGTLGEDETVIPYYAGLVGSLQVSASFADRKGAVRATARMQNERYTDRSDDQTLPGYLDGSLEVSYLFRGDLGVFGRVDHLSEGSYSVWENYPVPVWLALAGVRVLW